MVTLATPIALSSKVLAASFSSVLTLTWCLGDWMVAVTVCVASLSQYGRPGTNASSDIHTRVDSNWSATCVGSSALVMTSPREQSISSAKHRVTDWPATAWSRSPSNVAMRLIVLVLPLGRTRIASPVRITPVAIRPEKPRKSRFGRLTHCTGMQNGLPWSTVESSSTVSRWCIKVGPEYHGVLAERVVMLSPLKPEIGIGVKAVMPMLVANAR